MLYISQQGNIPLKVLSSVLLLKRIEQWLYIGEDSTWRIQAEAAIPVDIPRISIADLLDEMSHNLRQPYIDWIGELSEKNTSFEWWSSELAAKNPYHFFFVRLCLLAVARKLINEGFNKNTLIICSTPALFDNIAVYAKKQRTVWQHFLWWGLLPDYQSLKLNAFEMIKTLVHIIPPIETAAQYSYVYKIILETDLRYRHNILARYNAKQPADFSGKGTILFFTWVDRRSFSEDSKYTDLFFNPLVQMLKDKGYKVAFVPRIYSTIPFEEAVQRLIQTGETFFFIEQFITQKDINTCKKQQNIFTPAIPENATIGGIPVFSLAQENVCRTRALMSDSLLSEPLVTAMQAKGIMPHQIVHICEGHSWEQALSWSVHRHMPGTKVIGYDNGTFSRLVLSMYPAKNEYGIRPLPDRIVTNGLLFEKVLHEEGFPPAMVKVGCALRQTYLWNESVQDLNSPPRSMKHHINILIATAMGLGDSVELIAKAARAFGGNDRYELLIKCHPLTNVNAVKRYFTDHINHNNIHFTSLQMSELLPTSHIILYTYTSVCYDALIHGVVPIYVRAENFLNLDKLDSTPDIRWTVTTPEDLRKTVEEIMSISPEDQKAWKVLAYQIVRQALSPVTEQCIRAFVFE